MMRSSLVVSGGIIGLAGVVLFIALSGLAWLILFAGGAVVLVWGFLAEEVDNRIEPAPGYHFCQFCSTEVMEGAERCSHCNGLQPPAPRPSAAPAPPNR